MGAEESSPGAHVCMAGAFPAGLLPRPLTHILYSSQAEAPKLPSGPQLEQDSRTSGKAGVWGGDFLGQKETE